MYLFRSVFKVNFIFFKSFAFLVPNSIMSHKEAYLSFIFVHPDWRSPRNPTDDHISIGQYMLFYLIQVINMSMEIFLKIQKNFILFNYTNLQDCKGL